MGVGWVKVVFFFDILFYDDFKGIWCFSGVNYFMFCFEIGRVIVYERVVERK